MEEGTKCECGKMTMPNQKALEEVILEKLKQENPELAKKLEDRRRKEEAWDQDAPIV